MQLTANDPGRPALCHCSPILLPDGRHFLYLLLSVASSESGIFVGSLDARPAEQSRERVVATNFGAAFVPTSDPKVGTLLFLREDALLAQRLDLDTFQLAGTPTRIASGVGGQLEFGALGASTNGVLAYRTGPNQGVISLTLRWFDSGGELIGETPAGSGLRLGASLSPDGTRAAIGNPDPNAGGREDIWLLDFERNGALSRLTSGPARHWDPVWSPDGGQIAHLSVGGQGAALSRRSSSGSGAEEVVLPANGSVRRLNDWSDDGKLLLFTEQDDTTKSDLWVVPLEGDRKPDVFLNSQFNETQGQFSPDGRWVAYVSDETGQPRVYIQPFPAGAGGAGKIAVSGDLGMMPRWRRDGKGLFYVQISAGFTVMSVDFASAPEPRAGIPRELFRSTVAFADPQTFLWDVAPAGDRFLLTALPTVIAGDAPLTVVLNWQRMLEE